LARFFLLQAEAHEGSSAVSLTEEQNDEPLAATALAHSLVLGLAQARTAGRREKRA
jgi:hypothetical protein